MQFDNMPVELGKACSKGRDIAGPEPEVLVPVKKWLQVESQTGMSHLQQALSETGVLSPQVG